MKSRDIVLIARQRAGITQQQLADRSGHPRESIARWESGAREPSLTTLQGLVSATGLDLLIHLAEENPSLAENVEDQLALTPLERMRRLMSAAALRDALNGLRWLAAAQTPAMVVGSIAEVLQGAPNRPGSAHVEVVSSDPVATTRDMEAAGLAAVDTEARWAVTGRREPWTLAAGGTIELVIDLPGANGYADLRRGAEEVAVEKVGTVRVAHPRDLLRVADASTHAEDRARVPGLRALLAARSERG